MWIKEGYSLRQLSDQSGWSQAKLKRIKAYWLGQKPPFPAIDFTQIKYLIFDGTYFKHTACLMALYSKGTVLASTFCVKEDYYATFAWFTGLKNAGLNPVAITMDGNTNVMRACLEVWPGIKIQRCLYHIKHQAEMWLRRPPKRPIAKELKLVLTSLCNITTRIEKDEFWGNYWSWKRKHQQVIGLLKSSDKLEGDIISAYRMIERASEDMFHYLDNFLISSTTNGLEGYFSHLKAHYRQHTGLGSDHLANYLAWYIFFASKTNTS